MPDSTRSGGLLLYKGNTANDLKVLIAHPGGPFFKNRDNGYWSLPKGEPEDKEEMFDAALREFKEETGMSPTGPYIELGTIIQKNGKTNDFIMLFQPLRSENIKNDRFHKPFAIPGFKNLKNDMFYNAFPNPNSGARNYEKR